MQPSIPSAGEHTLAGGIQSRNRPARKASVDALLRQSAPIRIHYSITRRKIKEISSPAPGGNDLIIICPAMRKIYRKRESDRPKIGENRPVGVGAAGPTYYTLWGRFCLSEKCTKKAMASCEFRSLPWENMDFIRYLLCLSLTRMWVTLGWLVGRTSTSNRGRDLTSLDSLENPKFRGSKSGCFLTSRLPSSPRAA